MRTAIAAVAAIVAANSASAEAHETSTWEGRLVVYGWFSGIEGDVTGRNRGASAGVSLSPGDVLDKLETGLFALGGLSRGRFGGIFDAAYVDLSDSQDVGPRLGGRIDGDTALTMITAAGFYRAVQEAEISIDLYGGARYTHVDVDLTASLGGGALSRSASADDDWVDPIIGFRAMAPITARVAVTGLADIGGFGVGSDFSAQLFGGATFQITERLSAEAGLRYMRIDREADRVDMDIDLWGPTVGVAVEF